MKKHKYQTGGELYKIPSQSYWDYYMQQNSTPTTVEKPEGLENQRMRDAAGLQKAIDDTANDEQNSSNMGSKTAGVANAVGAGLGAVANSFGSTEGFINNYNVAGWGNPQQGLDKGAAWAGAVLGIGDTLAQATSPLSDPTVQNRINNDVSKIKAGEELAKQNRVVNSYEDLMQQALNANINYGTADYHDYMVSDASLAKTPFEAALKGAEAGSIGGPWGMLGGAVSNLITGAVAAGVGANRREAQARQKAAEINYHANQLEKTNRQNLYNAAQNYEQRAHKNSMLHVAALGGTLNHGANWNTGLTVIGNGGSHEQNPNDGVQMGTASDGQPNLVEEGEVIWNDYVFSERLQVPQAIRNKYKLRGKKELSFADVAERIQKDLEERPNDPIAKRGADTNLSMLAQVQEQVRAEKAQQEQFEQEENLAAFAADGGPIHIAKNKRGTFTAAATKHKMGVQEFASKVLANPDNYSPEMVKKANFARNAAGWKHANGGHLFREGSLFTNYPHEYFTMFPEYYLPRIENPYNFYGLNDSTRNTVNTILKAPKYEVPDYYEFAENLAKRMNQGYDPTTGKYITIEPENEPELKNNRHITDPKDKKSSNISQVSQKLKNIIGNEDNIALLRYTPLLGDALGVFSALADSPNYTHANRYEDTVKGNARRIRDVQFTPLGDYLTYTPLDRLFYANQAAQQANASRRGILGAAGSNPGAAMAGMLSSDYITQNALGNLYTQMEQQNMANKEKVATFNRGTNQYNSEKALEAQRLNAALAAQRASMINDAVLRSEMLKAQEEATVQGNRSAALTNMFNNLGEFGREAAARQMINSNPAYYYQISGNTIKYKNGFNALPQWAQDVVKEQAEEELNEKKNN